MLKVNNLSASFNQSPAIQDICLHVKKGDILGIVGQNGAGKTTLFRVILGLKEQKQGSVDLFGYTKQRSLLLPLVSYVPQKVVFEQNFPATVSDVVKMGITSQKKINKAIKMANKNGFVRKEIYGKLKTDVQKIEKTLEAVGILNLKDQRIGDVSGGELQRVLIAKALIKDPLLMILDEPVANIDVSTQIKFYDIITKINKENGVTVVWSSHDLDALSKYATKIACMNIKLIFHGSKNEFFSDAQLLRKYSETTMQTHLHEHRDEL